MTTTNARQLTEVSRQDLYELIWSTPVTQIAADLGTSDIAIIKRCIKLKVPRPSRGYWVKLGAGHKPRKKPLPPTADEVFAIAVRKSVGKALPLPDEETRLHPLASELIRELSKARLDAYKRATLHDVSTLPEVNVSKALTERAARAFHVILNELEPLGITFRKSLGSYDGGYFKRTHDRLYLYIEEDLLDASQTRQQVPWWQSQLGNRIASGFLTFSIKTQHYGPRDPRLWCESTKVPLAKVLAQLVTAIREHYLALQVRRQQEVVQREKQHLEWERQYREWQAQEAVRLQKELERKHASALAAVTKARKDNLMKAAELWRVSGNLVTFVDECERRWKRSSGEITAEQTAWLTWARSTANGVSPFTAGYPNPVNDGPFDADAVPFGGPYPLTRDLSHFPSL